MIISELWSLFRLSKWFEHILFAKRSCNKICSNHLDNCWNVLLSLKCICNLYWNNYFNSVRYFNSGCDVNLSLKFILNHYWNNYFNSGRYFISGCDVKLSLNLFSTTIEIIIISIWVVILIVVATFPSWDVFLYHRMVQRWARELGPYPSKGNLIFCSYLPYLCM